MDKNNGGSRGRLALKILLNLFLMLCVGVVLVWLSTLWLDSWTDHGHYATVPDVKGLPYEQALDSLESRGFEVELTDSVYNDKLRPGTVVEQNPKVGTKVKNGRLIYITVNAFSPRTVTLPNLVDTSLRQAKSILEGLGLKNISIVEVPSEFKNLVIAVKRGGVRLSTGARVPLNAQIVIEVGAGLPDIEEMDSIPPTDSVAMEPLDLI
ncbi:MAG: PASTA domain-containing protein [Muribaculaceae bacterium]|nr:PASTA domain-containing protein [Muribaculaceae bacterium]